MRALCKRLRSKGTPAKVACMRKLLSHLNRKLRRLREEPAGAAA